MSLVFATTFFFVCFFLIGGGGVLRHSAVQTDFEFEISGPLNDSKTFFNSTDHRRYTLWSCQNVCGALSYILMIFT